MRSNLVSLAALAAVGLAASVASGQILVPGTYRLSNHPDGNQNPPPYGLRLDELYNATTGHDVFSFDFDDARSNVLLTYTGSTITIAGSAWGGRDAGAVYFTDVYNGLYTFSFTYNVGVGIAPSDDDILVDPITDGVNVGSITTPLGNTIPLRDKSDGNFTFRLGDENNDLGHRGFNGISGWGWLTHGGPNAPHVADSDFLFTVGPLIPAPGAATALAALGLLAARRRR